MGKIGSYSKSDVTFLLKDIGNLIEEKDNKFRERAIQSGVHYSEMLPIEYKPTDDYMKLFEQSLDLYEMKLSQAVGIVSKRIIQRKGTDIVLVSLARAGTPIGILIKRYIKLQFGCDVPHYSISIIRGKGIDENAVDYILRNHPNKAIQFVDGWTGKGAITKVLMKAAEKYKGDKGVVLPVDMAVLADPGHCVDLYGTREDFLIPSACLNSTVSGLVSRTVLRQDLIGPQDYHGVKVYTELEDEDVSNKFVDRISSHFEETENVADHIFRKEKNKDFTPKWLGLGDVTKIMEDFQIEDINLVKPGIGETTRVLLRRLPWKILINEKIDKNHKSLAHIFQLAEEKNIEVIYYPMDAYICCGIIKNVK